MLRTLVDDFRHNGSVQFYVRVRPGMARTVVKDIMDDESVKIDIAAVPEGGKANIELMRFLAKEFDVPKNHVRMLSGAGNRVKLLRITKLL